MSDNKMPSNKKFGFFFSLVFFILSIYLYYKKSSLLYFSSIIFFFFLFSLIFFPNILKPLNRLWFLLGAILSKIVNPIVLGTIYFLLFSPLSIFFKLIKRDVLRIRYNDKSYWIKKNSVKKNHEYFKNQF